MVQLEVLEGLQTQSVREKVAWGILTTPWGSAPSSVSITVIDTYSGVDVTSTVLPINTPAVSGDTITSSVLQSLTAGHIYKMRFLFTAAGNTFEPYVRVQAIQ